MSNGQVPFWLVWNEGGHAPRVKHPDQETAEREAERLAKVNPGQSFVVLAVVSRFTDRRVHVERFHDFNDYLPF